MSRITTVKILDRGWRAVNHVWARGDLCGGCEHAHYESGSYDEEPHSYCGVLEEGESPFSCPHVSYDTIKETLIAGAEESREE